jgi:hypothetical protein
MVERSPLGSKYLAEDVLSGGTIYRPAFPAYRVFIYGQEVTDDVTSVRVNHSGGSAERAPGSCAITMNNHDARYVITHEDMRQIGKVARGLNAYQNGSLLEDDYDSLSAFQYLNKDLASTLATNPDLGFNDADAQEQKQLQEYQETQHSKFAFAFDAQTPWNEIKKAVLVDKLAYVSTVNKTRDESFINKYPEREIHDYPYQEGACIFHSNDPVRVAFRDPYDSRIWYWMFAGFVDSCTEDEDVNKDSNITITCTDVSKMARYALIQLSTGFMDPNLEESARQALVNVASTGHVPFQSIFQGFDIFEVLETIFFGSQSTRTAITQTNLTQVASMNSEDMRNYLVNNMKKTEAEVDSLMVSENPDGLFLTEASYKNVTTQIQEFKQAAKKVVLDRVDQLALPAVASPRMVSFKRKSDKIGLHYYYFQYDDVEAKSREKIRGEGIRDLNQWNEVLHHRVKQDDLNTMMADDADIADAVLEEIKTDPSLVKTDNVITMIGTDKENYPVGGGRVFFFTPATLNTNLGDVFERGFGDLSSMHSHFKDRLTYIYDMAERLDFRFYATPRGDLVFEMPFYDFNPRDFTGEKYGIADHSDVDVTTLPAYNDLFNKVYAGSYSVEDVKKLTSMVFETAVKDADLMIRDWDQEAEFDWGRAFTIEEHEQLGFSNTATDEGVVTVYRAKGNFFKNMENPFDPKFQVVTVPELIPTLGGRPYDGGTAGFLEGDAAAEVFAAVQLNRLNAEARNIGVPIVANFGLMANRPLFWRAKNYNANIVSTQHSIVWNSNLDTTVNLNQVRGWAGEYDSDGQPVYKHFGGDRAFNLANILKTEKGERGKYQKEPGKEPPSNK